MDRRWRVPNAKPGELKIVFGRDGIRGNNPELQFCWGDGASKRDTNMLMHFFGFAPLPANGRTMVEELEARGYDITTLKFSIQKRPTLPDTADTKGEA